MSAITPSSRTPRLHDDDLPPTDLGHPHRSDGGVGSDHRSATAAHWVAALTRLALGWIFLWALLDKAFGLGHDTKSKDAWLHGGHPTLGFLKFGTAGPFASTYHSIAGAGWADWLFMLGLLGIGVALIAGIGMRFAAVAAPVLLVLMWSAVLPPANNPFMDDHLVYALVIIGLALTGAGHTLGLGGRWEQLSVVQRFPWLR